MGSSPTIGTISIKYYGRFQCKQAYYHMPECALTDLLEFLDKRVKKLETQLATASKTAQEKCTDEYSGSETV